MTQDAAVHLQTEIFRRGSRTYFRSSHFFPAQTRADVTVLYGFVRVADDFVDAVPAKAEEFFRFRAAFRAAWQGEVSGDPVIDDFIELARRKNFQLAWIEDFLSAMDADLVKKNYNHLDEVLRYVWGSAEVIGLFLCQILELPPEAHQAACHLGRSMQFINFLRDIAEDHALGRRYFPLDGTGLSDLCPETCRERPREFEAFVRSQAELYSVWQKSGAAGYHWIPRKFLIPIKTASDLYNWTAQKIQRDPWIVWRRKVKPSKIRVLATAVKNFFYVPSRPEPQKDRA